MNKNECAIIVKASDGAVDKPGKIHPCAMMRNAAERFEQRWIGGDKSAGYDLPSWICITPEGNKS